MGIRSACAIHWNTALEKSKSTGSPGVYEDKSPRAKSTWGSAALAVLIMSAEESMPVMCAEGYRFSTTAVEFPGPQPRSMMRLGEERGTWERRSRAGRVRCSSNLRYCAALQSLVCAAARYDRDGG